MNVFSSMINHTIFHLHICLSLLLTEIRLAGWSAVFVCLCVCLYVCFVVLFPPSSLQVTIKERSLPNFTHTSIRHQSGEALIRFSRSWGQRSRSCSNNHGNFSYPSTSDQFLGFIYLFVCALPSNCR